MGEIDPVAFEDVLHLQLEEVFVGEDVATATEGAGLMIVLDRCREQVVEGLGFVDNGGHGSSPANG